MCVLFILTMGGRAVTIDVAKQDEAEKLHKVRRDESSLERESLEDEDMGKKKRRRKKKKQDERFLSEFLIY